MKNTLVLSFIRLIPLVGGFFAALSLVRSVSAAFNFYARLVYGHWFNMGTAISAFLLALCIGAFVAITCFIKPAQEAPYKKIDLGVIFAWALAGVITAIQVLNRQPFTSAIIITPIIAYVLPMLSLGELVARLRDKNLLRTLYWVQFFKTHSIWQPMGLAGAFILVGQLFIIIYPQAIFVTVITAITFSASTYFVAFLLSLSTQYEKANASKIQAEHFKSQLITNVSHDIKTPLTSIINYVDLLKTQNMPGTAAEYIAVLDRKSARLKVLIDDLMDASKASTGNIKINLQTIHLQEIIGQVAGEFEDVFTQKNLTLVLNQPENPMEYPTDNRHLYRVLENLFSNVCKYALVGTRVFLTLSIRQNKPCITLQNTSATPLHLEAGEAIQQFVRGDKARHTEGSGLGLYIAKSLMEVMGGTLTVTIHGDLFGVEVTL